MQFAQIPGHSLLRQQLLQNLSQGRVAHAQLFAGPEGSGALPLAIAYAQYLNCEQPTVEDSCGTCAACRKYEKLIHPDLHFSYPYVKKDDKEVATDFLPEWRSAILDNPFQSLSDWMERIGAENKQPNIYIKECHDIFRKLSFKAFEAPYKVLIMWLPEFLGNEGNALLKLIEEPPANTLLIFVAEQPEQMLLTIKSRLQLVRIKAFDSTTVTQFLQEKKEKTAAEAQEIAFLAGGNLSEAIRLCSSMENNFSELFKTWMRLCYTQNIQEIIPLTEEMAKLGREHQKAFLEYAVQIIREGFLFNQGVHSLIRLNEEERDFIQKFSPFIHKTNVPFLVESLEKASYHIERNANPKILYLDLSLQMLRLIRIKDVDLAFN